MNTGLILAGGVDPRFQSSIPKQFVIVDNRPVIVYTLQVFQNHPEIDRIIVSCLRGWKEMVQAYAKQFNIDKLVEIVEGGLNAQESIRKGVEWLKGCSSTDELVIIHDAIRPLVTDKLISDSIKCCRKYGMGVAAVRSMDTIMLTKDGVTGQQNISRDSIRRIQTPQTYHLDYLDDMHKKALEQGIVECVDNNSMLAKLGEIIHFSEGSDFNIKINLLEDIEMFKALYHMNEENK